MNYPLSNLKVVPRIEDVVNTLQFFQHIQGQLITKNLPFIIDNHVT